MDDESLGRDERIRSQELDWDERIRSQGLGWDERIRSQGLSWDEIEKMSGDLVSRQLFGLTVSSGSVSAGIYLFFSGHNL